MTQEITSLLTQIMYFIYSMHVIRLDNETLRNFLLANYVERQPAAYPDASILHS